MRSALWENKMHNFGRRIDVHIWVRGFGAHAAQQPLWGRATHRQRHQPANLYLFFLKDDTILERRENSPTHVHVRTTVSFVRSLCSTYKIFILYTKRRCWLCVYMAILLAMLSPYTRTQLSCSFVSSLSLSFAIYIKLCTFYTHQRSMLYNSLAHLCEKVARD